MQRWLYRIVQVLRSALPAAAVARTARATGLVERDREIGAVPFLWSFLFGTTQSDGSVAKVQDVYKSFTEHDAADSSIQQWITPDLKQLLTESIAHLSVELGATEPARGGGLPPRCVRNSITLLSGGSSRMPERQSSSRATRPRSADDAGERTIAGASVTPACDNWLM